MWAVFIWLDSPKGGMPMTVFEALMITLTFALVVIAIAALGRPALRGTCPSVGNDVEHKKISPSLAGMAYFFTLI